MKYMKITITKEVANGGFLYIHPPEYDKNKIVGVYEHKGHLTESCYGVTSDDFPETDLMVVITQEDYDAAVAAIKAAAAAA